MGACAGERAGRRQQSFQAVEGPDERAKGVNVASVCERLGMSRQNFYAQLKQRQRRQVEAQLVVELVRQERRLQPCLRRVPAMPWGIGRRRMRTMSTTHWLLLSQPSLSQRGKMLQRRERRRRSPSGACQVIVWGHRVL